MNLFYQPSLSDGLPFLDDEESHHALKVLRAKTGDLLTVTDGKGSFYHCRISGVEKQRCKLDILRKENASPSRSSIHLAVAPTKNSDKMEWLVEKATELGIHRMSFMICERSERKKINLERLEKIAVGAIKQSVRAWLPAIQPVLSFETLLAQAAGQKFIAHREDQKPLQLKDAAAPGGEYVVMIGPEGDFTDRELRVAGEHGFKMVGLGPNRLRTETAALVACMVLNFINE